MAYDRKSYETLANNIIPVEADVVRNMAAEIERLSDCLRNAHSDEVKQAREIVTLRARVEELEAEVQAVRTCWDKDATERDELRTQLANAEFAAYALDKGNAELRTRLASYEKAEPTIVKQTWQNVYADEKYTYEVWPSLERAIQVSLNPLGKPLSVAVLRRDHYSDGKVVAVLDSINQETK